MLLRGALSLNPHADKWRSELGMSRYPLRLPTASEVRSMNDDPGGRGPAQRYWASLISTVEYFNPLPKEKTRKRMSSAKGLGKYLAVWVETRLKFVGRLTSVDQSWLMFGKSSRKSRTVSRARLNYADGTRQEHRLQSEPDNPLHYFRWPQKKPLQSELRLNRRSVSHQGLSNYLAHHFARNANGAPLESIEFFHIRYRSPRPGQDPGKVMRREVKRANRPLREPYWRYLVASKKGRLLPARRKQPRRSPRRR